MALKAKNAIVYYGPSLLTGDPIFAALTGFDTPSANAKTGAMLQAWILRADMPPTDAVKVGEDDAICGTCPLKSGSNIGRACYVIWWLAPENVFKAHSTYRLCAPSMLASELATQHVRMGAYGDPAAVPFEIWRDLRRSAAGYVGYTHAWRTCDPRLRELLMASVDTQQEKADAQSRGWRTFHLRRHGDGPSFDEVVCPASKEGGYRSTCEHCELCRGASTTAKSVAIYPHGMRTKWLPAVHP